MHEHLKQCAAFKKVEGVEIPEIGLTMHVRTASAAWDVEWESLVDKNSGPPDSEGKRQLKTFTGMGELVLAGCLCDADGVRLFKDIAEARAWMADVSILIVDRLVSAALKLNRMGENLPKNSETPRPGASLSA